LIERDALMQIKQLAGQDSPAHLHAGTLMAIHDIAERALFADNTTGREGSGAVRRVVARLKRNQANKTKPKQER
jgi:hypothetical protein